jgi:TonB family protein
MPLLSLEQSVLIFVASIARSFWGIGVLRGVVPAVDLALMPLALVGNAGAQTAPDAAPLAQIIRQCVRAKWKITADGKSGQLPVIKLRLRFKPDGTLATAPVIANPDPQNSSLFLTISNSAAVAEQKCTPFPLPAAKYELWKDIILTFDPRDVVSAPDAITVPPGESSEGVMRPPGITHSAENDEFGRAVVRALRKTMPISAKPGRVTIKLILSDSGRLQEMNLVVSSGDPNLDGSIMFAAKQTRFPTPPRGATVLDRTFLVNYVYR